MINRQQFRDRRAISLDPDVRARVAESERRSFRLVWNLRAQAGRTRWSFAR
jgi:hypothetical protein